MRFSTFAVAAAGTAAAQNMTMMNMTSVCDKYTSALYPNNNTATNQFTLVALLVKTAVIGVFTGNGSSNPMLPGGMNAVPGILAPSGGLLKYFDGSLKSTNRDNKAVAVNFLDGQTNMSMLTDMPLFIGSDGSNQANLFSHLVEYFGHLLGCSQYGTDGFPAYAGSNSQYNVHKYMDISEAEHTYFIQQVGLAATSFGVSMADVSTVAMSLNSTFGYRCAPAVMVIPGSQEMQQVICQGSSCPLATNPVAGCSGNAAVAGYTPTSPAMAAASDMSAGSRVASTMQVTETATTAVTTGAGATGGAPRQTAAAGFLAGGAALAALML